MRHAREPKIIVSWLYYDVKDSKKKLDTLIDDGDVQKR
jgi:hypothetical protein